MEKYRNPEAGATTPPPPIPPTKYTTTPIKSQLIVKPFMIEPVM